MLGVTESAVYLRKKKLGAFRTAAGWMFDRKIVEAECAAKNRPDSSSPAEAFAVSGDVAAKVFAELDAGSSPTDIVKNLKIAPEAVKSALAAYHDLSGKVLLTGAHLNRLARLGIGIVRTSNADTIVGQVEAVTQSTQPCVVCRSRPPSVCVECSQPPPVRRRR